MAKYATLADWEQLGIPLAALASVDPSTKERILSAACSMADKYLGAKYTLPLGGKDEAVTMFVIQIATWLALTRRGFDPENPGDKVVRQSYLDAIQELTRIANGQAGKIEATQASPESLQPNVSTNDRRGYGGACETDPPFIGGGGNWG